ncbi:MAG: hypothetical protein IJ566_08415 [Cardiobacteriaceae bacterium]|nr:hypothetical protein [Cardiobacteriaceae bacterium]
MPYSVFIYKTNPPFISADFLFLPSIPALFRHFERSEKSIDRSFASLRMTTVLFGGFTVSR